MDQVDQIDALANELDRMIDRFVKEYDLSCASIVGILHMKIHIIEKQAIEEFEEGEEI